MNILLGVCGSIAAYKSAELIRLLRQQQALVRVVMTHAAQQFISPLTLQALSGERVYSELFDEQAELAMGHIELARWADVLLIAPATANALAKCAQGLADDLLSTLYLAVRCPVYIAPAMNQAMWQHSVTQRNVASLRRVGVQFIGPQAGEQACGDTGFGRMSEPLAVCAEIMAAINVQQSQCLANAHVLISAGPTREPLDPVRYLTNRSSGKMGYALASAALAAGAQVTLVSGVVQLSAPPQARVILVETAQQMYEAVLAHASAHDIYIGAAAVADYSPQKQTEKIKKSAEQISLVLQKNPDILGAVAALKQLFTVGFAAETEQLALYAQEKLVRKNVNMIAANWVGEKQAEGGFDSDNNALEVFWRGGQQHFPLTSKSQLAQQFILLIAQHYHSYHANKHTT